MCQHRVHPQVLLRLSVECVSAESHEPIELRDSLLADLLVQLRMMLSTAVLV